MAKSIVLWLLFLALVFAFYLNIGGYLKEQIDLRQMVMQEKVQQYTSAELEEKTSHQTLLNLNVSSVISSISSNDENQTKIIVVRIS